MQLKPEYDVPEPQQSPSQQLRIGQVSEEFWAAAKGNPKRSSSKKALMVTKLISFWEYVRTQQVRIRRWENQ